MKRPMLLIFILMIVLILGGQYFFEESIVSSYDGVQAELSGFATDLRLTKTGRQSFTLETNYQDKKIRVACLAQPGIGLEYMQAVKVKGELQELRKPSNEGAFNEWLYYKKNKIDYKMFPDGIEKGKVNRNALSVIYELRESMGGRFDLALPSRESAVIKAMVLGDKEELPEDIAEAYRVSGVMHILAISGLHVSVLAMALRLVLEKVCYHIKLADVIVILSLIFYALLTGGSAATVRAVTMSGVTVLGYLLGRDNDLLSAVSFAGVCLLIYEPLYVFDAGFQYSFSAVIGLIVLSAPMERALIHISAGIPLIGRLVRGKYMKKYLAGSVAATLVTLPITAWHFYYLPLYSIIGNLLILPTVSVLVIFGFLCTIFGIYAAAPVYALLKFYDYATGLLSGLPFSNYLLGRPSILSIALFYLVLLALAYVFSQKEEITGVKKKYLLLSAALCVTCMAFESFYPKKLEINVLDVGQADSLVFEKGDLNFAVDGGGAEVLEKFMDYNGIKKLNAAFVTHTDSDHVREIIELAKMNRISKIFLPLYPGGNAELLAGLLSACEENSIPVVYLSAGDRVELADKFYIDCLLPFQEGSLEGNNASLVLKVAYKDFTALLLGDIEAEAEESLILNGTDLRAVFLKVAHHGSASSSSEGFLSLVSPYAAAVSVGKNNSYGHPSPLVLERLEAVGTKVYNTAGEGAIKLITDGKSFTVQTKTG